MVQRRFARFRRRRGVRRRNGRNVWVNEQFEVTLTPASTTVVADLLTSAADFMTFDTTIVSVLLTGLTVRWNTDDVTQQRREVGMGLMVAPATMDNIDFPSPISDNVGAPWMWHNYGSAVFQNSTHFFAAGPTGQGQNGVVHVRAQRRFRENNSTLWFVAETIQAGADTNAEITGYARTLLRIP